nr:immunoglobulin light chain junction region [Macaca mulatta]MOX08977.1 immunoglobulin light chain junction region [Macaca mulatta]MOX09339.1 immunoglobulin light chain junction region [Macaca mulatta]MOX09494.1 immunoglobulin light chain junction region [Macaca mulatta]
CQQGKSDPPTF